tara:strand:+ start:89 stop:721 length:633 start_codon:yes stop_codon:yes gene_type:complete
MYLDNLFDYYNQFITIAIVHFFAVISPGPDFTVVTKQSFLYGRKMAIFTSIGIGCGILIHMLYCIIGFGVLLASNQVLYNLLKYIGAFYLLYIGISTFKSTKSQIKKTTNAGQYGIKKSFILGFVTNVFNPKATLFFLSLFAIAINNSTPIFIQIFYGIWMWIVTTIWFVIISIFFTTSLVDIFVKKYSNIINKVMGLILIFISIKLVLF